MAKEPNLLKQLIDSPLGFIMMIPVIAIGSMYAYDKFKQYKEKSNKIIPINVTK